MDKEEFKEQFEIRKELNAEYHVPFVGIELLSKDVVWAGYYSFAANDEDFIYFKVDGSSEYIAKIKLSSIFRVN